MQIYLEVKLNLVTYFEYCSITDFHYRGPSILSQGSCSWTFVIHGVLKQNNLIEEHYIVKPKATSRNNHASMHAPRFGTQFKQSSKQLY